MQECDLVVVGGGTAGIVAAKTAGRLGARVVLVESARTGGDCLWTGCVPSKALIAAAHAAWPRLTLLAVLLLGAATLIATQGTPDVDLWRARVQDTGTWAPVLFVLGYAVGAVLLVPGVLLTAAGGALFGVLTGSALVLAGATLGAVVSFLLGRSLGRPAVERIVGGRLDRLDGFLARRGLLAVIGLRLVPVVPFALLNYGSGVTALRLRDYTLGSAIGMAPAVVAYTVVGGSLTDPTSPQFLIAVTGLLLLTLAGLLAARRIRHRDGGVRRR